MREEKKVRVGGGGEREKLSKLKRQNHMVQTEEKQNLSSQKKE